MVQEVGRQVDAIPPRHIRFRLSHVFYLMAMLASALATFGSEGWLPALVILSFWGVIFTCRSRPVAFRNACLILLFFLILFPCLLPPVESHKAFPRTQCNNNLKQIGLGLDNYHDRYGTFPPAFVADKDGKPMHSWRVLLLPFLEGDALYNRYRFDEPWNGPNNRLLLKERPAAYTCPTDRDIHRHDSTSTSYTAIVGPHAAWRGSIAMKLGDIQDDPQDTVLVVEGSGLEVAWSEPRDLDFETALGLMTPDSRHKGHRTVSFFYEYDVGRHVMFADCSVSFLAYGAPRDAWSKLFTTDDGQGVREAFSQVQILPISKKLKWGNCFRLAVFVLLTVLPLPWIWLNPNHWQHRALAAIHRR